MTLAPVPAGNENTSEEGGDSATTQLGSAKWLAFKAPQQHYLFALEHIGQVLQVREITRVPFTHAWFRGVINVRGVLHGVVDLAAFLSPGRAQNTSPSHKLVASADNGGDHLVTVGAALNWPCALVAGSLQGLRNPSNFPGGSEEVVADKPLLIGIRRDPLNTRWMEVNLPALVASVRANSIQAQQGNL